MSDGPLTRSFRKMGALEFAMAGKNPSRLVAKALEAEKTRLLAASKAPKVEGAGVIPENVAGALPAVGDSESGDIGVIPENVAKDVPAVATPPGEEK